MSAQSYPMPEKLRADLQAQFARAPEPVGSQSRECADIAFHALREAMSAIERVTMTAPADLRMAVLSIAIGAAPSFFKGVDDEIMALVLQKLLKGYGK